MTTSKLSSSSAPSASLCPEAPKLVAVNVSARQHVVTSGDRALAIVDCSITELWAIDILVSSDDNYLSHGGGVSNAIWTWLGDDLDGWYETAPAPFALGEVVSSPLPNRTHGVIEVLHAVTIDFDQGRALGAAQAPDVYAEVIRCAESTGLRCGRRVSVALPVLATGAGRLAPAESLAAAQTAMARWLRRDSSVGRIIIVAQGVNFELAKAALAGLQNVPHRASDSATARLGKLGGLAGAEALIPAFEQGLRLAVANLGKDGSKLPVGGLAKLYISARQASKNMLDELDVRLLENAISARNRLAHGVASVASREEAFDALMQGIEVVERDALAELLGGGGLPLPDLLSPGPKDMGGPALVALARRLGQPSAPQTPRSGGRDAMGSDPVARKDDGKHEATPPSGPEPHGPGDARRPSPLGTPARSGTKHVRELRDFFLKYLNLDELDDMDLRLTRLGYKGERSDKLLEFTLRMEQPDREIAGHLGEFRLRRAVKSLTGEAPSDQATALDLALRILDHFGYPTAPAPLGLRDSLTLFEVAKGKMASCSRVELLGHITVLAARLEYLVLALLRFLCRVAFESAPEPFFGKLGHSEVERGLAKLSLGSLLALLEILSKQLDSEQSPPAQRLRATYGTNRISVGGTQDITRLRNGFMHFEKQAGTPRDPDAERVEALHFADDCLAFLNYLGGNGGTSPRIFPQVVRVERVVVDRWGRRTIEVRTDEGRDQTMFTDDDLSPGDIYFVHPFTNPIWVEFLYVPAGDLFRSAIPSSLRP